MIRRLLNFWRLKVLTGPADPNGPNAGKMIRVEYYDDRKGNRHITSAWRPEEEPLSWWKR